MRLTFRLLQVCALILAFAALSQAQTSFSNTNPITTPSTLTTSPQNASPYPSQIAVSGLSGTISKITVTLNGWTENGSSAFPADRDFLLVGPNGATLEFLSGCDLTNTFSNITLTLDDSASSECGDSVLASGTFKPTNRLTGSCTNFPSPAPASSNCAAPNGTATFTSTFNGGTPNGTWSLYIFDNFAGDSPGSISSGWTITITTAAPASTATTVSSNLNPSFTSSPNNSVTMTATVSSSQTVSQGTVTFFDGSSTIGSPSSVSLGQATLVTTFTTEGNHQIKAQFNGTAGFSPSSGTLVQEADNHTTGTSPTFCDAGTVTLATTVGIAAPANVYPQHVYVTGLSGTVSAITLQLPNITHNLPDDLDFLLVGPTGTFVPLASAGGSQSVSGVTLTLGDAEGSLVPASSLSTGSFLPTDYNSHVVFPAPAPVGPYNLPATQGSATFGTSFAGIAPNGTWSLYVYDHASGDSGTIGGYCLEFTTSAAAATTTSVTANPSPGLVGATITFTAQVTSSGSNVTQGTVNFEENGTILAGPVSLNANGQASFTTSTLSEGIHVVTALYSGVPGSYNVSSGMVSEEIDRKTVVTGTTYCNPGGITIPPNGATQPYPSRVFVSNLSGTISKVTVTLDIFTHQSPSDAEMLLTGPMGTNLVFWGDAGGTSPVTGLNVILDDAGSSQISSPVVSGTFKPTATSTNVVFPSPAPANPSFAATAGSATFASSFAQTNPNGTWSFYLFDSNAGSGGSIGQVCLNFTEHAPILAISKSHTASFTQGDSADTYTIQVTNNGPGSTSGLVTVNEVPPTGLTVTGMSGTNWSCSGATCTRSDALSAGNSYDSITVTVSVATDAPSNVTNQATVSGGGSVGTQTANDPTTVLGPPVLSVTKSHTGTFTQGQTANWSLSVSNTASGTTTSGNVILSDTFPIGYTLSSYRGTGWSCTGTSTANCMNSTAVAGGSAYSTLTLTVNVPVNSPVSVSNTAMAVDGGALHSVNSNTDTVTVNQVAATITATGGASQSTPVNTAFTTALQATVKDAGSNPEPNVSVTFTAPASGASGTFSNNTNTISVSTNSSGVASETFTANGTPGGPYTVTASVAGASTPAMFSLTNVAKPVPMISTQPVSQPICQGANVTFTAAATGNPTPTVQWQVSADSGAHWTNIPGATSTTLTFSTSVLENGTEYRAVFTNSGGSTNTNAATLTVETPPVVIVPPLNDAVAAGGTATFVAAAIGTPTPTVLWQVSTNGGASWSNIAGAISTTLSFTAMASQNGYKYRAVFTTPCGMATTSAATLTIDTKPAVTLNPSNQTVCAGQNVSFKAAASGNPSPFVQWQVSTNGGSSWSNIPLANSATLTFPAGGSFNGYKYRAVFTNLVGTATTSAAALTVNTEPEITSQPHSQSVVTGHSVTFTASASGRPTPTVQWQVGTNSGRTWTNISGATSPTLTFTASTSQNHDQYRAVFSGPCGQETTNAATLSVTQH